MDWLCNVARQLQWGVELAAVASKLVLGELPLWRAEESSEHICNCIGVAGPCLHTASLLGSVARAVVGSSFLETSKQQWLSTMSAAVFELARVRPAPGAMSKCKVCREVIYHT